ncbi:MAG: glycine cleavage system aminomethyltransferase GcvT [Acidobacteriota bacterium]
MLKRTPLYEVHRLANARMVPFAGWEMPVQYSSALAEHHAVRQKAGLFDVSHMGRYEVRGSGAYEFLQHLTCNDVARLVDGQAQYSAFLNEAGGFIDDIVVYRLATGRYLLCVNAARREADWNWLEAHRPAGVELVDRSEELAQIALQGPLAEEILQPLTEFRLSTLEYYHCAEAIVDGVPLWLSRTGYTGERGFELYLPAERAVDLWTRLVEAGGPRGLLPAGLAARNTLRLEVGYRLYGNDIDETTTPLEAGLAWIVKFGTGFIGEESLLRQKAEGLRRKLTGFTLVDPGIARDGCAVYWEGRPAGRVTSGGFSPTLNRSIGMAYLPPEAGEPGTSIEIEVRDKRKGAVVCKLPFLRRE